MDTTRSHELYRRAQQVIPRGIYGHYGSAVFEESPAFFETSSGSRFTDIDGNTYIDWMCAYGPMILGYNNPKVDEAAALQMAKGNTVSLAAPVLVDLAEQLVDMVDGVDWALFGKNGADSTGLAVMVARAATGRRYIVKVDDGYHGTTAWMQRPGNPGMIDEDYGFVLSVPWNDPGALQRLIDEYPDDIACFISSPYHHPVLKDNVAPDDGYWDAIQAMCRKAGTVLIVDEVRSGFRVNLRGAHVEYGFEPDMVCFGKAIGNGHPIAALTGVDALKQAAGDVFFTGTQFFNAAPMAATLATLRELQAIDGTRMITDLGVELRSGLIDVAASHGHDLRITGVPAMPYFRIESDGGFEFHARWVAECVKRGAYILSYHNNFISTAHTEADLKETWDIADQAFAALD